MKINRQEVYDKYNGHCAYCGYEMKIKDMQVDHIAPKSRIVIHKSRQYFMSEPFEMDINDLRNLNPACRICNGHKNSFDLETFRKEISKQIERARNTSFNFRTCERYGLIQIIEKRIIFYFETLVNS